jgi:hypothetical protein
MRRYTSQALAVDGIGFFIPIRQNFTRGQLKGQVAPFFLIKPVRAEFDPEYEFLRC